MVINLMSVQKVLTLSLWQKVKGRWTKNPSLFLSLSFSLPLFSPSLSYFFYLWRQKDKGERRRRAKEEIFRSDFSTLPIACALYWLYTQLQLNSWCFFVWYLFLVYQLSHSPSSSTFSYGEEIERRREKRRKTKGRESREIVVTFIVSNTGLTLTRN